MKRCAKIAICWMLFAVAASGELSVDLASGSYRLPSNSAVIGYLLQSVNWYRHVYAERQLAQEPADLMFLDENQAIEREIVKLSFDFAKADATLQASAAFSTSDTTPSDPPPADLAHFVELRDRNDQLSRQAMQEIEDINKRANGAKGADRGKLNAAAEEAQTRLQVLGAVAQGLNELIEFVQGSDAGQAQNGHLDSTIDELGQSIPEVMAPTPSSATVPRLEANSRVASGEGGILGLVADVLAIKRKLHLVDEKIRLTDNLTQSSSSLRIPMAGFLSHLMQSVGDNDSQPGDLASLRQQKSHLDALTLELKELSPLIVALDKQKVLLAEYESHVLPWRIAVAAQYKQAWRQLLIRLSVVSLIIGLLFVIGQLSRRFIVRNVHDPNRRRFISMSHQFLTLFAIAVVVVFVLASDLKSVATYFGLLSAGLLLALENVILSTLGAFLLVGKRGIRIGDRVQVSGVTGDVIDMGLLQFQLKEFDVQNGRFTGHVATFSNSLVFVSPATGLVRFDSATQKSLQAAVSKSGKQQDMPPISLAGSQD